MIIAFLNFPAKPDVLFAENLTRVQIFKLAANVARDADISGDFWAHFASLAAIAGLFLSVRRECKGTARPM